MPSAEENKIVAPCQIVKGSVLVYTCMVWMTRGSLGNNRMTWAVEEQDANTQL